MPIFLDIESRNQQVEKVEEFYGSDPLPFVSLCSLINSPIIMTWLEYIRHPKKQFLFAEGSAQEAEKGAELLRNEDTITLDITALLTMHELNLLDHAQLRFSSVSIPQFVFDEVQSEAIQIKLSGVPKGVMGKNEDGRYTFTEITEDAWKDWEKYAFSVLESAKTLRRIPSYPILSIDKPQEFLEFLKMSGMGTIYLGDEKFETDSILVSDDLALSRIARANGFGVVNSQSILEELLHSDIISDEIYSSKIEELTLMNYWYVRVNANDILRSLESSSYRTTQGTRAILKSLRGPYCAADAAANVATNVINSLSKIPLISDQYELLVFTVLSEIRRGRLSNSILQTVEDKIHNRLILNPVKLQPVFRVIEALMQSQPPK